MPRVAIPLVGPSYTNREKPLSAQVSKNLWPELNQEARSKAVNHSGAGTKIFATLEAADRGLHNFNSLFYAVNGGFLYSIDDDGVETKLGAISGSGRCVMASDTTQLIIVTGATPYRYTVAGGVEAITDSDLVNPTCVAYMNSQFVFDNNNGTIGEFVTSSIQPGLSIDALDFATAESHPDDIIAIVSFRQLMYFFGSDSIEPWQNTGTGNPPWARYNAGVQPYGLAGRDAIVKTTGNMYFLDSKRIPRRFNGTGEPVNIGTPPIGIELQKYSKIDDCIAFEFTQDNQQFVAFTFPTANRTWCFHEPSGTWWQMVYGMDNDRHRASSMINIYGLNYCADHTNGLIYEYSMDVHTDNGMAMVRQRDTAIIEGAMFDVPGARLWFDEVEFVIVTGETEVEGTGALIPSATPADDGLMYMLFGGGFDSKLAIQYISFDGTTVTDLNPGAYVTPTTVYHGFGTNARVTPNGTILQLCDNGDLLAMYYIQGSSQPYFVPCYERTLDWDDTPVTPIFFTTSKEKAFKPNTAGGVAVVTTTNVASHLEYYRGTYYPASGANDGVEAAQSFIWHNGYLIGLNEDYGLVEAWSWDGETLTPLAEATYPYPAAYYTGSGRMASDGKYIYFSQIADWEKQWGSPPEVKGKHAGVQVMTFDGTSFDWVTEDVDELNQVPDHLGTIRSLKPAGRRIWPVAAVLFSFSMFRPITRPRTQMARRNYLRKPVGDPIGITGWETIATVPYADYGSSFDPIPFGTAYIDASGIAYYTKLIDPGANCEFAMMRVDLVNGTHRMQESNKTTVAPFRGRKRAPRQSRHRFRLRLFNFRYQRITLRHRQRRSLYVQMGGLEARYDLYAKISHNDSYAYEYNPQATQDAGGGYYYVDADPTKSWSWDTTISLAIKENGDTIRKVTIFDSAIHSVQAAVFDPVVAGEETTTAYTWTSANHGPMVATQRWYVFLHPLFPELDLYYEKPNSAEVDHDLPYQSATHSYKLSLYRGHESPELLYQCNGSDSAEAPDWFYDQWNDAAFAVDYPLYLWGGSHSDSDSGDLSQIVQSRNTGLGSIAWNHRPQFLVGLASNELGNMTKAGGSGSSANWPWPYRVSHPNGGVGYVNNQYGDPYGFTGAAGYQNASRRETSTGWVNYTPEYGVVSRTVTQNGDRSYVFVLQDIFNNAAIPQSVLDAKVYGSYLDTPQTMLYSARSATDVGDGSNFSPWYTINHSGENWTSGHSYVIGDTVWWGHYIFNCISAHTASSTDEPETGANWATYWEHKDQSVTVHSNVLTEAKFKH